MPGIRKQEIVQRLESAIRECNAVIHRSELAPGNLLPWMADLEFPSHLRRRYRSYVWTIGHGGKSRPPYEYRIQTKLKDSPALLFGESATTLLLGYYHASLDVSGKAVGNNPSPDMEVIVAWDPLMHLRLGSSSSCQVPFGLLDKSRVIGVAEEQRRLANGDVEKVIAMRPDYLSQYLAVASGGHQFVDVKAIETFRFSTARL